MQCKCGATMRQRTAVRSKQKAVLEYQECPGCQRVHIEWLKINGEIVARDRAAADQFRALDDE